MIVASGKRELKLLCPQAETVRETAKVDVGAILVRHFCRLTETVSYADKESISYVGLYAQGTMPCKTVHRSGNAVVPRFCDLLAGVGVNMRLRIERVAVRQVPASQLIHSEEQAERSILGLVGKRCRQVERQAFGRAIESGYLRADVACLGCCGETPVVRHIAARHIEGEGKGGVRLIARQHRTERSTDREIGVDIQPPGNIQRYIRSIEGAFAHLAFIISIETAVAIEMKTEET